MFERFTERARQVVVLAGDEARELDHNYIGSHIPRRGVRVGPGPRWILFGVAFGAGLLAGWLIWG